MPYNIRAALVALNAIQVAVAISVPATVTVKTAYQTIPKGDGMPDLPSFMNFPKAVRVSHMASARAQRWQVRSQLFVYDASQAWAADVVLALMTDYIDRLSQAITLDGGIGVILDEAFSSELPLKLPYAGREFIGGEYTIVLQVPYEDVTVGP
jgi:hypothetical protein